MILNKFIDKTFKAAKQSALQIYRDDYSMLKSIIPKGKSHKDGKDTFSQQKQQTKSRDEKDTTTKRATGGVVYERSGEKKSQNDDSSDKQLNKKLESIRNYAAQQSMDDNSESIDQKDTSTDAEPSPTKSQEEATSLQSTNNVYSRKDIRNQSSAGKKENTKQQPPRQDFDILTLNSMNPSSATEKVPLYNKFVKELPNGVSPAPGNKEENGKNSATDIHKRLDRLESLMHLALSTPDTAYSEHPLFHRLLHKGVSQKLIHKCFERITEQGIQPHQQPELFHSKLLHHIDELLRQSKAGKPKQVLLFAGRSGAGKTHLIMKLASLPDLGTDKNIAIASFAPTNGSAKNKYSILEPFCDDQGIDFFWTRNKEQVKDSIPKWKKYDHVLIDTPALEMEEQTLIGDIMVLKELLEKKMEIETHYLINTAVNGTAFNDPLAKDIDTDHIAFTHIDQSLKWGKTVQLLANTDYKLRYISSGPTISDNLFVFDPEKFAHKLLQA
ncbi:hypothetical protein [Fodinibius salsisoli]|uniref:SRP54-type proteins GTP-binding domain-containing protein n=1 Tax=Fodinibius salsisoli TaxID=2820877 RepID=A0ABT3PHG5_9BACT|nr:hypothetical protein [Fodinibius salsisoli]MCW9705361.1 hypothetical protein [Fodinibius salsisoli]